ncbi:arf-GAP domain and FG repeat-containing protein 1 isoform X1 [Atheta coriaria]|uniref:arf-GAP domain and FG repeat-containing protein 1 isoform X1 n=1 Tax=Dalotia coriaria TaxID=877792 RepID=UPI0031F3CCB6
MSTNMASARRKQDEKNLKTLRELVSQAANKHCFECNQRGPTYVNVTIGSFVCTKCSGMLRGLTPPHRVKSISMATFTQEEVELLKTRGNDYCQQVWLGLYEGTKPSDERSVHTLMLDKYERKRYYMEPSIALRNSYNKQNEVTKPTKQDVKPLTSIIAEPRPLKVNSFNSMNIANNFMNNGNSHPGGDNFIADFAHADIFNASSDDITNCSTTNQASFANFDNNPIFCNENFQNGTTNGNGFHNVNGNFNGFKTSGVIKPTPPALPSLPQAPAVDRYAALKDLDNELKTQTQLDWNSAGSNSSLYSSPTTPGSFYSSTASPQSSSYGSPSQGQFMNLYPTTEQSHVSNPFNLNGTTGLSASFNGNPNPFRASPENFMSPHNGDIQSAFGTPINGTTWTPNPFKIASGNSSNPFL